MVEVHAGHARARLHADVREAGERRGQPDRQLGVVDGEPLRGETRDLAVAEDIGLRVAVGQHRETLDRHDARGREILAKSQGGEIRHAGRMDQLPGQPLGPVESGLDHQHLVSAVPQSRCDRGAGDAAAGHDHVDRTGHQHRPPHRARACPVAHCRLTAPPPGGAMQMAVPGGPPARAPPTRAPQSPAGAGPRGCARGCGRASRRCTGTAGGSARARGSRAASTSDGVSATTARRPHAVTMSAISPNSRPGFSLVSVRSVAVRRRVEHAQSPGDDQEHLGPDVALAHDDLAGRERAAAARAAPPCAPPSATGPGRAAPGPARARPSASSTRSHSVTSRIEYIRIGVSISSPTMATSIDEPAEDAAEVRGRDEAREAQHEEARRQRQRHVDDRASLRAQRVDHRELLVVVPA